MELFKKLFIQKSGDTIKPKDEISENNPLDLFLKTLTPKEQETPFLSLSSEHQHGLVKAIALFQLEAMGDLDNATLKAMNILSLRMHKLKVDALEIFQRFAGSKEDVKEEEFSLKIFKANEIPKSDKKSEYADENSKEPKNKIDSLWNQQYAVLDIIQQVKEKLPTVKEKDIPFITSNILLIAEFLSVTNVKTMNAGLENLIDKDVPLNVSFAVEAKRVETEYYITPTNAGFGTRLN